VTSIIFIHDPWYDVGF